MSRVASSFFLQLKNVCVPLKYLCLCVCVCTPESFFTAQLITYLVSFLFFFSQWEILGGRNLARSEWVQIGTLMTAHRLSYARPPAICRPICTAPAILIQRRYTWVCVGLFFLFCFVFSTIAWLSTAAWEFLLSVYMPECSGMHSLKCKRLAVLFCERLASCDSARRVTVHSGEFSRQKHPPLIPLKGAFAIQDFIF